LLAVLGGLFVSTASCSRIDGQPDPAAPTASRDEKAPDLPEAVSGIIERTNAFRKEEERQPVKANDKLTKTAEYFADFMARTDKYGHDADEKQPAERAKEHGYDYCIVAENIAYALNTAGFSTDELTTQFVKGWKESPEHRKNMLDPDVTETGVAVARSESSGKYYAVQMFGRPKSAAIAFSIANESGEKVQYEIEGKTFDLEPRVIRKHTLCRPEEIKPQWPDAKAVRPESGDTLTVVKEGDAFQLRKKSTP
jgi:uncharacterized protein YkwD